MSSALLPGTNLSTLLPVVTREKVITAIINGNTLRNALKLARLPYGVVNKLLTWAADELENEGFNPDDYTPLEHEIFEFYEAIQSALAHNENALLQTIRVSTESDWKAAKWLLEKSNPIDWETTANNSKKAAGQHVEEPQSQRTLYRIGDSDLDLALLSTDELIALKKLIQKATVNKPAAGVPPVES